LVDVETGSLDHANVAAAKIPDGNYASRAVKR